MANKKTTPNKKEPKPETEKAVRPMKHVIGKERKHHGDPVGAIFLISVGILFLLNNFGIIPWSVWGDIWRFWPVFLILGGLRMILGRNIISNIIVGLLGILFFGSMLLYSALSTSSVFNSWVYDNSPTIHRCFDSFIDFSSANIEEIEIVVEDSDYSDVEERNIDLDIGTRTITVSDDDDDYFIKIDANYIDGYNEPKLEKSFKNNLLSLSLETNGQQWGMNVLKNPFLDITIGKTEIPTSLNTTLGAGTATLDFKELLLSEIIMNIGAGTLNMDLSKNELSEIDVFDISVGAGTINLDLPSDENIGWKITYGIGLGTLNIDGNNYRGDGEYTSENYSDSTRQIAISVDAGVGTVDIDFN